MAESAVSFVLSRLNDLITSEANLLLGVRDEVQALQRELEWILSFLRDADRRGRHNERVKLWVAQIRDASYDAEDIIESFFLYRYHHRRHSWLPAFLSFLCSDLAVSHSVGKRIQEIRRRLESISANRSKYGIEPISEETSGSISNLIEQRRMTPVIDFEALDIVGFDKDAYELVEQLLNGDSRRSVVSIVGMGGVGKTTLARKVYRNIQVRKMFHCFAWVSLSQDYHARDVLQGLIRSVVALTTEESEAVERMGEEQLTQLLRDRLTGKKYLIVLDDLWSREAWSRLQLSFPNGKNGSRVLLTTRNKDVALCADPRSSPYELKCLGEEDSWLLFCKKVFVGNGKSEDDGYCPDYLDKIGRHIVEKCSGLPLAIVVVGGLLSRKVQSLSEWERVLSSLSWQLIEGEDQISGILALSYHDMPYYLKPCFLYFSVFPEDANISRKKVIQLWLAEGFVQRRGEEALEDVAEDYLVEMIDRSLIQVAKRSSNGRIKTCLIHDLLRDFVVAEAGKDKFLDHHSIVYQANFTVARRLAVHSGSIKYVTSQNINSNIRSLSCYTHDEHLGNNELRSLYRKFKFLRVLDLDGVYADYLPNGIGELAYLKYLGIRETHLKKLPASICRLYNLQTLHIRNTTPISLPVDICKMTSLRHLRIGWMKIEKNCQVGLLCNLQTLKTAAVGSWIETGLCKLKSLRNLSIRGDLDSHKAIIYISELKDLQSLRLRGEKSLYRLPSFVQHNHLYSLYLKGAIHKLPEVSEFPPNLTKISLDSCRLEKDPIVVLEKLQNLQFLRLAWNAYVGKEMVCSANRLLQLRVLRLEQMHELEEWRVEDGALPRLQILHISRCPGLKALPSGLKNMASLKLELKEMHRDFH